MARNDGIQITDEDLLPDGATLDPDDDNDGEVDIASLRVNFSSQESESEARDFTPLPTGKYHVAITNVEIKKSKSEKNFGKPFYALTLTVQDGPYENRKLFANVMLFEGALYSLVQIIKAQGWPLNGQVPTPDDLAGTEYVVKADNIIDDYKIKQQKADDTYDPKEPKPRKNEVKAFFKYDGSVSVNNKGAATGPTSLMP